MRVSLVFLFVCARLIYAQEQVSGKERGKTGAFMAAMAELKRKERSQTNGAMLAK